MKIYLAILAFIGCNLIAHKESRPIMKNYFQNTEEEIHFGRIALPRFSYTASSCVLPEYCAHNLFDSNANTYWTSIKDSTEEWIVIDFGTKRLMNRIEVNVSSASQPISSLEIQVLHRKEWTTIHTLSHPIGKLNHFIGNIDASTLRFYFPKKHASTIALSELKILLNDSVLTGLSPRLSGYAFPIYKGMMPEDDYSFPGAPRKYRNGIHKGLDISFKAGDKGEKLALTKSTPILSIGDGVIVRADLDYKPMSPEEYKEITTYNQSNPVTFVHRDFGGRQVWIDHGNGVMSSYNHMNKINNGIQVGKKVRKGESIGTVGNSGLRAEANGTNEQIHLHLEIWIDGEFLGNDLQPEQSKKILQLFFSGY
jgi:hypothetical protein